MSRPAADEAGGLWRPLRTPIFRHLLFADVLSDIGTFMQSVGAAWLMVSLGASPFFVALTQTASTLPFFLFALPAGSLGDIADRRKLILFTETWMVASAAALAITTITGVITPWLLLALTFALSAGDAVESPTWRAVLPELVQKEDLPAASALNGIEFNMARAVGPALAGALIAAAGVGAAFVVNVLSFAGVIVVVARWRRPVTTRTTPVETIEGATVAALRYVRHAPLTRALMLRSGAVMFCASAIFALLPAVARGLSRSATGYGLLLGAFGLGAIAGAVVMQRARAKFSAEAVVSTAIGVVGASAIAVAMTRTLAGALAVMLVGGGAWITFISLANAAVQRLAPDWVRARILAMFMLITQGGMAAGSLLWGALASRVGVSEALMIAGVATIASTALAFMARVPDAFADVSPWNHWRLPVVAGGAEPALDDGPVLVTVEYRVGADQLDGFLDAVRDLGSVRRRDGASRWGIFRDLERPEIYVETFVVPSWAEHLRQHERLTRADRDLEERVAAHAGAAPVVRHLVSAPRPSGLP